MHCKIESPLCGHVVFPTKWLSIPLFSFLRIFFQDFCFKMIHLEVLSPTKEGEASFLNTLGKRFLTLCWVCKPVQYLLLAREEGKKECLQARVLAHLPSLLLGGTNLVLTMGWAAGCRFEGSLSSWPNPLFGSNCCCCCCCSYNCWVYCCPKQMSE